MSEASPTDFSYSNTGFQCYMFNPMFRLYESDPTQHDSSVPEPMIFSADAQDFPKDSVLK